MALQMDGQYFWNVMSRFGFGKVTGSGFPGESAGVLRTFQHWRPLEQATLSYGYGLSVTPLQLAQAYGALADQGRLHQPTLILGADNPTVSFIDPAIAQQVVEMLATVPTEEGTARRARVEMYKVAGKTGTSHKASAGGYEDRYISSFAGFAPVSNPRLVCVVVINDPSQGGHYGGLVAVQSRRP